MPGYTNRTLLIALMCSIGLTTNAQQCTDSLRLSTPSQRFIILDGGIVKDRLTGLQWQRCAMGQTWEEGQCKEDRKKQVRSWFTWQGAKDQVTYIQHHEKFKGWRIPSRKELESILEVACTDPTINTTIFPNAPAWPFWAATEMESSSDYAWTVDFETGESITQLKETASFYVRLTFGDEVYSDKLANQRDSQHDVEKWNDGIHDTENPDLMLLQHKDTATEKFESDSRGNIDWAATLRNETIKPRAFLNDRGEMEVLDQDIIYKQTMSMPHVKFPHKTHTEWLSCENCHDSIFRKQANLADIDMKAIYAGEFCGKCHGKVAFSPNNCERCHSVLHSGSPIKWW